MEEQDREDIAAAEGHPARTSELVRQVVIRQTDQGFDFN